MADPIKAVLNISNVSSSAVIVVLLYDPADDQLTLLWQREGAGLRARNQETVLVFLLEI